MHSVGWDVLTYLLCDLCCSLISLDFTSCCSDKQEQLERGRRVWPTAPDCGHHCRVVEWQGFKADDRILSIVESRAVNQCVCASILFSFPFNIRSRIPSAGNGVTHSGRVFPSIKKTPPHRHAYRLT